ncbi:hypothetical protein H072_664 [Dactylellina haptotyla CBS 200.50]|uniref:Uncharacterized protein n=1 Tax=Dactylellina haptotyla (strain CBS 200.50) TaxID=1284197 RepID=S8CCR6_DACHA|nr:hypothetical protein H072_664 [Dactylellina haptotyla CBS 200.50]
MPHSADEANLSPEDATEWEELRPNGQVSIPQMATMSRLIPYHPSTYNLPFGDTGLESTDFELNEDMRPQIQREKSNVDSNFHWTIGNLRDKNEPYDITPDEKERRIPHIQWQNDDYTPLLAGLSGRSMSPTSRYMTSSNIFASPFRMNIIPSGDSSRDTSYISPINMDRTGHFSYEAIEEESKTDLESWSRPHELAKYPVPPRRPTQKQYI